jgi:hypothetical protein
MIIVYRAANIADAHLIRQMLEREGIPAFIQGEYLQGAVGELPANTEILVRTADEYFDAARAIVDEWERAEPVEFEADGSEADVSNIDDHESSAVATTSPSPLPIRSGIPVLWIIGALFFGGVSGAAATWALLHAPQPPSEIDYDNDGRADESAYYFGERLQRVELDRNRDGKMDQTLHYDADGFIASSESDDDFDDRVDSRARYRDGQVTGSDFDLDGDGQPEYRAEYRFGLMLREEYMGADGILLKRVEYRHGWPQSDQFDSDGDGRLDTSRRYDRYGEIVATERLPLK